MPDCPGLLPAMAMTIATSAEMTRLRLGVLMRIPRGPAKHLTAAFILPCGHAAGSAVRRPFDAGTVPPRLLPFLPITMASWNGCTWSVQTLPPPVERFVPIAAAFDARRGVVVLESRKPIEENS